MRNFLMLVFSLICSVLVSCTSGGAGSSPGWNVVTSGGDTIEGTSFIGNDANRYLTGGVSTAEVAGEFDIRFYSENIGWAVGHLGEVIKTTDGGLSATRLDFPSAGTQYSVFPMTEDKVWVSGKDTNNQGSSIFATTDGGSNWAVQLNTAQYYGANVETASDRITSLFFIDTNTGFAAGRLGYGTNIILKTTNGSDWTGVYRAQTSGTDDGLRSIFFVDQNVGYAVGFTGVILKTTDAGATWNALTSGTTNNLHEIRCADANRCIIVGDSGMILGTLDGGTTWSALTSGVTESLSALDGVGDKLWAGGYNGVMIHSTDGGVTWTSQTSNTGYTIQAIFMINDLVGWSACGYDTTNNGAILHTTNGGE